jgi:hypothetical protein
MNKGAFVIRTALTAKLPLELTYREHRPESADPDHSFDALIGDCDSVTMSASGDRLNLPALHAL